MGYWSDIATSVRAEAATRFLDWLAPVSGRQVLALGARHGTVAWRLAHAGARVTACDPSLGRLLALRGTGSPTTQGEPAVRTFLAEDPAPLRPSASFDVALVMEEIEGLPADLRKRRIEAFAEIPASQLAVAVRVEVRGRSLLTNLPEELRATVEPRELLRHLHLTTPFRLERFEQVCRRRFALELWHLRRY